MPKDNPVKPAWLEMTETSRTEWLKAAGQPAFRAGQISKWIVERRATSFEAMTDLPKALRDKLAEEFSVYSLNIIRRQESQDGTCKMLLEAPDGGTIECVLMPDDERVSVCISSQIGCGMGCVFCASGLGGLKRNLTTGEILQQVLILRNQLPPERTVSHIVVMGMGESLANLDQLIPALDWICSAKGLGISQRRVTISTVGLPEKIEKLAELDRQYHLAISLHAATPELRDRLIPVNQKVGLEPVMQAAGDYFNKTGRQVTYEYILLGGVNDRPEDATALVKLLRGRKSHVNLIPYNPVDELVWKGPLTENVLAFRNALRAGGLSVTIRKRRGRDIDAAC
ncbi:MAG: 23S rRNA (adenine(2503)-C(2))-methyltransferase RlmN, partial [Isosphaeraceae bacterium]